MGTMSHGELVRMSLVRHCHAHAVVEREYVARETRKFSAWDVDPLVARVLNPERTIGRLMQFGRARVSDRIPDHGKPQSMTAYFFFAHSRHCATFLSCSALVAANFVSPVSVLTVTQ